MWELFLLVPGTERGALPTTWPCRESVPTAAEQDGTAHLRWLRGWPGGRRAPTFVRSPLSSIGRDDAEEYEGQEGRPGIEAELSADDGIIRLRRGAAPAARPGWAAAPAKGSPDYSPLLAAAGCITAADWAEALAPETPSKPWDAPEPDPNEPFGPDRGPDGKPRTLDDLNEAQAALLLRQMLGDAHDSLMQQVGRGSLPCLEGLLLLIWTDAK